MWVLDILNLNRKKLNPMKKSTRDAQSPEIAYLEQPLGRAAKAAFDDG